MQSDEIKQRLSVRRPHSDDQHQAELAAAWHAAQNDPSLREWIAQEEDFDTTVAEAFAKGIAVPADLKERLLQAHAKAEAKAQAGAEAMAQAAQPQASVVTPTEASPSPQKFIGKPRKRRNIARRLLWDSFQRPYLLYSAIACLAVALTVTLLTDPFSDPLDPDSRLPRFYDQLISHYTIPATPLYPTSDIEQIRSILRENNAPQPNVISDQVATMKKVGCEVFELDGQPVSLIRLQAEGKTAPHFLYIISRKAAPEQIEAFEQKQTQQHRGYLLKSWSGPQNLYLLASPEATEANAH